MSIEFCKNIHNVKMNPCVPGTFFSRHGTEIQVPGQGEMDNWEVEEEREKEEAKVTVVKVNVSGGVGPLTSRDSINQKSYILLLMPLLVLCQ